MIAHPRPFTWKIDTLPVRNIACNNRPSRPGHYQGQPRPAIGSARPWWRGRTAFIAAISSKRASLGRGRRASCEETAGSTGLGDGVIAEEAKGAVVLPGQGHSGPPGIRSRRGGGSNWEFVSTRMGGRPGDAVGSLSSTTLCSVPPPRFKTPWRVPYPSSMFELSCHYLPAIGMEKIND